MRILVVHAGREGQSAKVAAYAAARLRDKGHDCDLADLKDRRETDPAGYPAMLAVGSVHVGRHESELTRFITRHLQTLSKIPTGFFSVSLSPGNAPGHDDEGAMRQAEAFLRECGWTPERVETIAGALRFSRYGMMTRLFMQQLMRRFGVDADRKHDIEYTDWRNVDRAVDGFLEAAEEKNSASP